MKYDELIDTLHSLKPDIDLITAYWEKAALEQKYADLKAQSEQPDFWQHPQQATLSQALQHLETQREKYHSIISLYNEFNDLVNLFKEDEQELQKIAPDIQNLTHTIRSFKVTLLLNKEEDKSPCFLHINAGAGGTESQDWTAMLLRMYIRFCEQKNLKATLMDSQPGEEAGIKSATLYIKGKKAYGLLKGEQGIHRLVRISPFDASKRRHTSFAAVSVTPERPEVEISIDPGDLRIDTYRASGAGGQHVNKTESAVRITHLPTKIVAQCQNERSQLQNRETAMKMLKAKLIQKEKEDQEAKDAQIEKKKIEWGSQIRSYILHPYKLVKDHRTKQESPQPEVVLDGSLMPFIESYLTQVL